MISLTVPLSNPQTQPHQLSHRSDTTQHVTFFSSIWPWTRLRPYIVSTANKHSDVAEWVVTSRQCLSCLMWRTFVRAHGSGKDTYIPHDPSYWGHAAPRIDTPRHWASAWDTKQEFVKSPCKSASTQERQKLKLASSYYNNTVVALSSIHIYLFLLTSSLKVCVDSPFSSYMNVPSSVPSSVSSFIPWERKITPLSEQWWWCSWVKHCPFPGTAFFSDFV